MGKLNPYKTVESSELRHMLPDPKYIAGLDYNWAWVSQEITEATNLWNEGVDIKSSANVLDREEVELFVLWNDLLIQKKIQPRDNGIYGTITKKKERKKTREETMVKVKCIETGKIFPNSTIAARTMFPQKNATASSRNIRKSCMTGDHAFGFRFEVV